MNFEQRVRRVLDEMVITQTYVIADSSYDSETKKSFWAGAIVTPNGLELLGGLMYNCGTSNIAEAMAARAALKRYESVYGNNSFTLVTDSDAVKKFNGVKIIKVKKHGRIDRGLEFLTKLFKVIDRQAYKALRSNFGRKMRSK